MLAAWLAACGGSSTPPHGSPVTLAADQALGWLGVAPRSSPAPGDWLPAGPSSVVVAMPASGLTAGTALSGVDTAGHVARLTAGAPSKLAYGCDQNRLDVVALSGARLVPGPVWLLPANAPATWRPAPVAIAPLGTASQAHRRTAIGPLALDLRRIDATHGTLAITRPGHTMFTQPFERAAIDGAPGDPLDLRGDGVAIPVPIAAWSLGADGPILIVLRVASYEGTHLTPILVEAERAREVTAMASYLYSCAF
ncbi:MAG TPA: hypothetical protein VFP84_36360 [Kofleriaceae bacterium]|nr:hypothetical protein [Kofleriaceae bacterium]